MGFSTSGIGGMRIIFLCAVRSGRNDRFPTVDAPFRVQVHPIGAGPFKFVEFRPNERIRVTRSPDYQKPGRPYLDGIEWPIVPSPATRILGLVA